MRRYYVLRNNVVEKVLRLLYRREKWLVVAAVRFLRTCLGLKDDFYNRYLVSSHDHMCRHRPFHASRLHRPALVSLLQCLTAAVHAIPNCILHAAFFWQSASVAHLSASAGCRSNGRRVLARVLLFKLF